MFLSTAQLIGLPGLPCSRQAIARKAGRDRWAWIPNPGQGGGKLYAIESLPPETQAALLFPAAELKIDRVRVSPDDRLNAKAAIVNAFQDWTTSTKTRISAARGAFTRLYNQGQILTDRSIRKVCPKVSVMSIFRWGKLTALKLKGNYGNRRGQNKIDTNPDLSQFCKGCLANGYSAAEIHRQLKRSFPAENLNRVTVWRWVENYRKNNPAEHSYLTDPQGYRNKHMAAIGSYSESIVRRNQQWQIDATKLDIVAGEREKEGNVVAFASTNGKRYTLISLIDVYSRRVCTHLCDNSNADEIGVLIRKAIVKFGGIPEEIKTDRGKDFVSQQVTLVLGNLGVKILHCEPYQPQQKPFVERGFGTLNTFWATMPGYCGYNPLERRKIESRQPLKGLYTFAQLQQIVDGEIDNYNLNHQHSSIGCTPMAKWESDDTVLKAIDPRDLDLMLSPCKLRRVDKKGITIGGNRYASKFGYQEAHKGQKLKVQLDPNDAGTLLCYDPYTDEFLYELTCPELHGQSRIEYARNAKLVRKEEEKHAKAYKHIAKKIANNAKLQHSRHIKLHKVEPVPIEQKDNLVELSKKSAKRKLVQTVRALLTEAFAILESIIKGEPISQFAIKTIERARKSSQFETLFTVFKRDKGLDRDLSIDAFLDMATVA